MPPLLAKEGEVAKALIQCSIPISTPLQGGVPEQREGGVVILQKKLTDSLSIDDYRLQKSPFSRSDNGF